MATRNRAGLAVVLAIGLVVAIVAAVAISRLVRGGLHNPIQAEPTCTTTGEPYDLTPEMAGNAATISVVGMQRRLPTRAITIALATALQESKLRNLDYGDADSVGLFQQRPSQGWGNEANLQKPRYAAGRFYDVLVKVHDWRTRPLTDVAQAVQRSAYPDAYAKWEPTAEGLAGALTGSRPASLGCNYPAPGQARSAAAAAGLRSDLGVSVQAAGAAGLAVPVNTSQGGWRVAAWAVAHGQEYGVTAVRYRGRHWDRSGRSWQSDSATATATTDQRVRIDLAAPAPR